MPIIASEPTVERGRKDARRHREKQREAIKKRLPEIISDESIITHKKGKTVKVLIKSIDIPHFKPKTGDEISGIGQGPGEPGDIIGQRRLPNGEPGEAGQEPGEDYIETEIPIEELIEMMLEDLGLPKLEEKEIQNITIELGWKIAGLDKAGIWPLLDKRATARQGIRRFWYFLRALESETGQDELTCFRALKQSKGILTEALTAIKENSVTYQLNADEYDADGIKPFPIFTNEDLRYHQIKKDTQEQSRAVVIAMMDVSGSMDDMKKYLARSMIFWLVELLRRLYLRVEIRFIIHHAIARIVPEEDFFRTVEGGGTLCYTAYEKAVGLVDSEYPTDNWNVYVWHFSDGNDFDPHKTLKELNKLIAQGVNMVGYGEINPDGDKGSANNLWGAFKSGLQLEEKTANDMDIMTGPDTLPFLCVRIEEKEDILPALKTFLRKDRWAQ